MHIWNRLDFRSAFIQRVTVERKMAVTTRGSVHVSTLHLLRCHRRKKGAALAHKTFCLTITHPGFSFALYIMGPFSTIVHAPESTKRTMCCCRPHAHVSLLHPTLHGHPRWLPVSHGGQAQWPVGNRALAACALCLRAWGCRGCVEGNLHLQASGWASRRVGVSLHMIEAASLGFARSAAVSELCRCTCCCQPSACAWRVGGGPAAPRPAGRRQAPAGAR